MNSNDTKTLWIAVGSAIFAVFLLYSWIQEKNKEMTDKFGKRSGVVVAKKDINEMYPLDETAVEIVEVPEEYIAPQAVTDPAELRGYVALNPIMKGEQILKTKISKPGALTGLSFQVSPGKRAVTIPVDEMRGVARLLKPGDRVDLIASVVSGVGQAQKRETKVLMQNAVVLATGTTVQNQLPANYQMSADGNSYIVKSLSQDTDFNSITIEATPSEAQKLVFILSQDPTDLFMILRHPSDTGAIGKTTTDVNDVLGKGSPVSSSSSSSSSSSRSSASSSGGDDDSKFASRSDLSPGGNSSSGSSRGSRPRKNSRFKSL